MADRKVAFSSINAINRKNRREINLNYLEISKNNNGNCLLRQQSSIVPLDSLSAPFRFFFKEVRLQKTGQLLLSEQAEVAVTRSELEHAIEQANLLTVSDFLASERFDLFY